MKFVPLKKYPINYGVGELLTCPKLKEKLSSTIGKFNEGEKCKLEYRKVARFL